MGHTDSCGGGVLWPLNCAVAALPFPSAWYKSVSGVAAEIGRPRLEGPNSSTGMIRYGKEVKAPGGFARGPGETN